MALTDAAATVLVLIVLSEKTSALRSSASICRASEVALGSDPILPAVSLVCVYWQHTLSIDLEAFAPPFHQTCTL